MKRYWKQIGIPGLSVVLLAGMMVAVLNRPTAADADSFHQEVKAVCDTIPMQIGDWVGQSVEPPPSAIKLLNPNVLINRKYSNIKTRRTATLLIVQCFDARDLVGHYPPNCYPAHGWILDKAEPASWQLGDGQIRGTEYRFSYGNFERTHRIVIRNFMIIPNGQIYADMQGIYHAASDYVRRFFGAAQVQLITESLISEADRDRAFGELVGSIEHVIELMRRGGKT